MINSTAITMRSESVFLSESAAPEPWIELWPDASSPRLKLLDVCMDAGCTYLASAEWSATIRVSMIADEPTLPARVGSVIPGFSRQCTRPAVHPKIGPPLTGRLSETRTVRPGHQRMAHATGNRGHFVGEKRGKDDDVAHIAMQTAIIGGERQGATVETVGRRQQYR